MHKNTITLHLACCLAGLPAWLMDHPIEAPDGSRSILHKPRILNFPTATRSLDQSISKETDNLHIKSFGSPTFIDGLFGQ
jgi:hypothetical protein